MNVMQVKAGDKVFLKREWCEAGEYGIGFLAIDDMEQERVTIQYNIEGWTIQPTQVIQAKHIERVETSK